MNGLFFYVLFGFRTRYGSICFRAAFPLSIFIVIIIVLFFYHIFYTTFRLDLKIA